MSLFTVTLHTDHPTLTLEGNDQGDDDAVFIFSSSDPIGTLYTMQFHTSEEPVVMVCMGNIISNGWTWNPATNILTTTVQLVDFGEDIEFGGVNGNLLVVGFMPVTQDDGPPIEAKHMWFATNVLDWRMIPPNMEQTHRKFGIELTAPAGHNGFFKMYIPNTLISWLNTSPANLVMYENGEQSHIQTTPDDNGVLFNINAKFTTDKDTIKTPEEQSNARLYNANPGTHVHKIYETGKAQKVSIASDKNGVRKYRRVKLYGWIGNFRRGRRVRVYELRKRKRRRRRGKGVSRATYTFYWRRVRTTKTKTNGYWRIYKKVYRNTTYRVKYWKYKSENKRVEII